MRTRMELWAFASDPMVAASQPDQKAAVALEPLGENANMRTPSAP
jgi:hypothetical protein